jgi:hypothetical protein
MAAKPTLQKSMSETIAFPFCFLQEDYDVTRGCIKSQIVKVESLDRAVSSSVKLYF